LAVTIGQEGELKSAADLLAPEFIRYRTLIRQDRRRRYLGWAALAVSIVWLAISALNFFNLASPSMILAGVGLTLLIPGIALLFEASRTPTLAQTAVSLDRLLDNRQRMITSVELLASGADRPITEAQLASSASILERVNPRKLYPARLPVPQLVIAGGLLLLALGLFIQKGLSDDKALLVGNLPSGPSTAQAVPSSTPQSSLPGAAPQQQSQAQQPQPQPGQSSGTPLAGSTQNTGAVSPQQAQQQAADSRDAQKALQRLAQALDQQSVTQAAADAIRQGDYNGAANDLTDLGKNNDQLSDQAKKSMAGALSGAAVDSSAAPQLQNAEQNAANALTQGDYAVTSDALNALAQAIKDTGSQVIPQQDLSKDFPDQNGQQGQQGQQNQKSQSGQNWQQSPPDQNSQKDQNGQQGQNGQQDQSGQNGQQDQNGQSGQDGNGQNGQNGQSDQNSQQNQQDQQGNQSGSGTGNLPGEGSQVQGPTANKLNVPGNPFVIDGSPDPNANKPGDGTSPPAMTLNGSPGGSTQETAPSQGGPVTASGENNSPPASRWGIVQKYFGGGSQQSQQNPQNP
jgi:hypothetical protein